MIRSDTVYHKPSFLVKWDIAPGQLIEWIIKMHYKEKNLINGIKFNQYQEPKIYLLCHLEITIQVLLVSTLIFQLRMNK